MTTKTKTTKAKTTKSPSVAATEALTPETAPVPPLQPATGHEVADLVGFLGPERLYWPSWSKWPIISRTPACFRHLFPRSFGAAS